MQPFWSLHFVITFLSLLSNIIFAYYLATYVTKNIENILYKKLQLS